MYVRSIPDLSKASRSLAAANACGAPLWKHAIFECHVITSINSSSSEEWRRISSSPESSSVLKYLNISWWSKITYAGGGNGIPELAPPINSIISGVNLNGANSKPRFPGDMFNMKPKSMWITCPSVSNNIYRKIKVLQSKSRIRYISVVPVFDLQNVANKRIGSKTFHKICLRNEEFLRSPVPVCLKSG